MPIITRQYTDLETELTNTTTSLQRWSQTQEDLEIKHAQNTVNSRLISPPQLAEIPTLPFPIYNLIFVALGSLSLGAISAVTIDKLDKTVYTLNQLNQICSKAILGYIPCKNTQKIFNINLFAGKKEKYYPSFTQLNKNNSLEIIKSSWSEYFNDLYSNLYILISNYKIKSLVISSANFQEGKTTISLNLAKTAANIGKKVLLVDTNLRNPQIHKLFNIENNNNLSDILTEKIDLSAAIKQVDQEENLSVITAGDLPNDITRLLLSSIMEKTIENLSKLEQFDLIIYDTPPMLDFVDAKILASHTDGLILVAQLGKITENNLQLVTEKLNMAQITWLGIVANMTT